MTHKRINSSVHQHFIDFMEADRNRREWTLDEMAEALRLSVHTYKNIIYGKSTFIDIELACRLYDLTHSWMWQMCGYSTSDFDVLDQYTKLGEKDQALMQGVLRLVIERNNNDNS